MSRAGVFQSRIPSVLYRRQARRIRAIHRGDAAGTHAELLRLNSPESQADSGGWQAPADSLRFIPNSYPIHAVDKIRAIDWSASAILGHRTPQARRFADEVALQLIDGILPATARQKLLAIAGARQISRFEANLIIAAVQHHIGTSKVATATPSRPRWHVLGCVGLVMVAEAVAAGWLWQWFH